MSELKSDQPASPAEFRRGRTCAFGLLAGFSHGGKANRGICYRGDKASVHPSIIFNGNFTVRIIKMATFLCLKWQRAAA